MSREPSHCTGVASAILLSCLLLSASCAHTRGTEGRGAWEKVELDVSLLDANGLRGPPDGKVAVAYEFAIPKTEDCIAQVRTIDPTVQFMPGSPGRIGAGTEECLCIGSTHQESHLAVLESLADLPFVDRIIECHFE